MENIVNNKRIETCLEKYGVENAAQSDEVKQKTRNTIINTYGSLDAFYKQLYDIHSASLKYNRKYYGMSKIEQETYRYLCSLYSIEDIRFNEIIDERYPFHVDFYITSIDIFIEINAHYAHGGHIFGTVETDELVLEQLKQKIKENQKSSAKEIIRVWTQSDPLKIQTAKDNNLLYLPIWSNEIKVVIEEIEKFFKEHNIELPQPTYEYTENELFPKLNKKEESK